MHLPSLDCLDRVEFKGFLCDVEIRVNDWSFKAGVCQGLDHSGFDGREYRKDTLLILCLTIKQCCKKRNHWSSHTHMYTVQLNTQRTPAALMDGILLKQNRF